MCVESVFDHAIFIQHDSVEDRALHSRVLSLEFLQTTQYHGLTI